MNISIDMTNKDAIMILNKHKNDKSLNVFDRKAYDMAIKALAQKPCEDAVSRQYIESKVEELENICTNAPEEVLDLLADIKNAPYQRLISETSIRTCMNCFHNYGVRHNVEFNPEDIVCEYWESDGLTKDDFCSRWKDKESEE